VQADQERAQEVAEEIRVGNDEIYKQNKTQVEERHDKLKVAYQEKCKLEERVAHVKQQIRNHQLKNMMLEENIDEQIDKQIEVKQKAAKARKQIARTMKKTETYLVDVERLLREKLSALQSQEIEDRRLKSERQIVEAKKSEALKATIKGENQRINMRMHFERDQAQRDQERMIRDQIRDGRRQCVEDLGSHVQMLSTRVLVKEGQLANTLMEQESQMKQVMRQLESTQASLLRAY